MASRNSGNVDELPRTTVAVHLLLFVAGDNESSLTAYGNNKLALEMFRTGSFELEVVNVWDSPDRAFADRVFETPTLLAPSHARRLVGDLSKWSHVRHFLQTLANLTA